MNNTVINFPVYATKRNLYIVDNYFVILAHNPEQAVEFVRLTKLEEDKGDLSVRLIEDNKILYAIKSGKVEIVLWDREPNPLERVSFTLTTREFIDKHLKRHPCPSSQDILEDRGAILPKF